MPGKELGDLCSDAYIAELSMLNDNWDHCEIGLGRGKGINKLCTVFIF
jgi:hypothetical protein